MAGLRLHNGSTSQSRGPAAPPHSQYAHPTIPSRSIDTVTKQPVSDQPRQSPERAKARSAIRRGTARISAMTSAVSSVSTPGVLVTVIRPAAARSKWSTPAERRDQSQLVASASKRVSISLIGLLAREHHRRFKLFMLIARSSIQCRVKRLCIRVPVFR